MRISDALVGVKSIYLDTAPVIYLVERHAQFRELIRRQKKPGFCDNFDNNSQNLFQKPGFWRAI